MPTTDTQALKQRIAHAERIIDMLTGFEDDTTLAEPLGREAYLSRVRFQNILYDMNDELAAYDDDN